ncbi:MAG TPA: DUF3108 domain-containing protein [Ramlibacter sp.]|uniref:DUF3108 domain-containing protein n=1 Tax=Ramlibacter sp. TaxID=1917967 RepID=UPI002ED49DD5
MARHATLKLSLLAAGVLLGHLLALEWLGREADAISGLREMAPVMYTRLLQPATPPPVVAMSAPPPVPKARIAPRPKRKASEAKPAKPETAVAQQAPEPVVPVTPPEPETVVAQAPAEAASAPAPAASAAQAAASAAVTEDKTAEALDRWPVDTRLTYRLTGDWRGPLFGDARVQWQRENDRYQVRLDVKVQPFFTQVLTSQGEVTANGLVPRAYEEMRPGKRRAAQFGDEVLFLENGRTIPRPPGVQDTASQFVELSQRFATGKAPLEVGRTVSLWLARPGAVDLWTYDIVGREMLRTPKLGEVEAFHLKPRPIANPRGNITAEMWFAPSLQYLPVKIRVLMGNEAYLDLLVEHIEQR